MAASGQLLSERCSGLSSKGPGVHVVSGRPSYTASAEPASSYGMLDGAYVHRLSLGRSIGREKIRSRVAGYLKLIWLRGYPVRFLFVRDGASKQSLQKRTKQEEPTQVPFLPFQPEERFVDLLPASDACFVSHGPGLERFSAPSRAYIFLSAAAH